MSIECECKCELIHSLVLTVLNVVLAWRREVLLKKKALPYLHRDSINSINCFAKIDFLAFFNIPKS
jgi:hypothetical protein